MKPNQDTAHTGSKGWLATLLFRQLGGAFAFDVKISDLKDFREKNPQAAAITMKNIAGIEVNAGIATINCIELGDGADRHETAVDKGGYRITNYFVFDCAGATKGKRMTVELIGINRHDLDIAPSDVVALTGFLRDEVLMKPGDVQIDARFVGDTAATLLRFHDGTFRRLEQLVVLGYSPGQGLLLARDVDGRLYAKFVAELYGDLSIIDRPDRWTKVAGIDGAKIFRVGRMVAAGNVLVAPISIIDDLSGQPQHGVVNIKLAAMNADIKLDLADAAPFIMMPTNDGDGRFMAYNSTDGMLERATAAQLPNVYKDYAAAAQAHSTA